MSSPNREEANRRNARRSTGPKTAAGKAVASRNALKHGLLSKVVLLPGDDGVAFQRLTREMRAALAPLGDLEIFLADRVITSAWRLRRALQIERDMMTADLENRLMWWTMHEDESTPKPTLGQVVGQCEDEGLGKVTRYESHLERTFYRALHELQRLQAVRSGTSVPPPAALHLDVDVTGDTNTSPRA